MRLYLSKKLGSWGIHAGIKITPLNCIFVLLGAMTYWAFWLMILTLEIGCIALFYICKYSFIAFRFLFRKAVDLTDWIIDRILEAKQKKSGE